ncbi:MAG: NAD(P)/FAD-dependent oxidoreductase [Candidatus Korarchaeota archaeon]
MDVLTTTNLKVVCIEREGSIGGLLRSEIINKFVIDIGGSHIIFSRNTEILHRMLSYLGDNVTIHDRASYILINNKVFVPYPLENNLSILPMNERYEALISFLEALHSLDDDWRPKNLSEWINAYFGSWISKKYLIPYNRKIWKRSLEEIDVDWIYTPGRLPIPDWRDVIKGALGIPVKGYPEQARFYYPLNGGIQALVNAVYKKALSQGAVVLKNYIVKNIKKTNTGFIINDNIRAKRIYSTIPLPELLEILDEIDAKYLIKFFDFNQVIIVAVALNKPAPKQHWIYVPNEDVIFHRYAWLSNYSPNNAPLGKSLVIAEITLPQWSDVPEGLVHDVIKGFERINVFEEKDVMFVKTWIHRYGYPIHRIGFHKIRDEVLRDLKEYGIVSLGRWGTWRYLNMDMILKDVLSEFMEAPQRK